MKDENIPDATEPERVLIQGRLQDSTDRFVQGFTASVGFDKRLFEQDITNSMVQAQMLSETGVITQQEAGSIVEGLEKIRDEITQGEFTWRVDLEDVHMNIENRLTELIGEAGKKVHTGRSRNDQIATDLRLFLITEIDQITSKIRQLLREIAKLADENAATIMPGFTHLQVAQPITFGHHLMAWFSMLERDLGRLTDCKKRTSFSPMGSAALAGSTFYPDRIFSAGKMGFQNVCDNSLDAVSDRDFAIEFCSVAAITMTHFSRWCEELILWSSDQFDFVELPDRFCTGSSIMPQKKNPDVPELIRGKTGRTTGNLISLLTLMKAQPLAYNKDNQEDKEPLFDSVDTLRNCVDALNGLIPNITAKPENMRKAAESGFSTATDLADYLVKKGLPFRTAHDLVGRIVKRAITMGKRLDEMSLPELSADTDLIGEDIYNVLTPEGSVASRDHHGGTAPQQVKNAIKEARARLSL